jgi:hypothetical protein
VKLHPKPDPEVERHTPQKKEINYCIFKPFCEGTLRFFNQAGKAYKKKKR